MCSSFSAASQKIFHGCSLSNALEVFHTEVREEICELFKARWCFESPGIRMFPVPGLNAALQILKAPPEAEAWPFQRMWCESLAVAHLIITCVGLYWP